MDLGVIVNSAATTSFEIFMIRLVITNKKRKRLLKRLKELLVNDKQDYTGVVREVDKEFTSHLLPESLTLALSNLSFFEKFVYKPEIRLFLRENYYAGRHKVHIAIENNGRLREREVYFESNGLDGRSMLMKDAQTLQARGYEVKAY